MLLLCTYLPLCWLVVLAGQTVTAGRQQQPPSRLAEERKPFRNVRRVALPLPPRPALAGFVASLFTRPPLGDGPAEGVTLTGTYGL